MDSAVLTTVLVISLATNGIVLGLLVAGRIGWVRARGSSSATTSMAWQPASLMPVMALPRDDADHGRRAWIERADALAAQSRLVGKPVTVVVIELLTPPQVESPVDGGPDNVVLGSVATSLRAMAGSDNLVLEDSPTTFHVLLVDSDEAQAAAFVDQCKHEFDHVDPAGELIAAWALSTDDGLDVAVRLAEARLAGRREGWIRSVAVR